MGNLLGSPVTTKDTHVGKTHHPPLPGSSAELDYGISSMQGWRIHMEDAHIAQPFLFAERRVVDQASVSSLIWVMLFRRGCCVCWMLNSGAGWQIAVAVSWTWIFSVMYRTWLVEFFTAKAVYHGLCSKSAVNMQTSCSTTSISIWVLLCNVVLLVRIIIYLYIRMKNLTIGFEQTRELLFLWLLSLILIYMLLHLGKIWQDKRQQGRNKHLHHHHNSKVYQNTTPKPLALCVLRRTWRLFRGRICIEEFTASLESTACLYCVCGEMEWKGGLF
jgi:hypothetical protein